MKSCFPEQIHFFFPLIVTVAVFVLSACGARLVAAIRAALVKGRSSGDAVYAAADETAKELRERICQLHQIQKQTANGGGTGISPTRVMYNHSLSQPSYSSGHTFAQKNPLHLLAAPLQPKAHAINHATAYGGRDTVKALMALLDEEASTPLCRNKAELLSEDQPVLDGAEGICILTLFRSAQILL